MSDNNVRLTRDESGLWLKSDTLSMRGDFSELLPRVKKSNLEREILVKAVRIKTRSECIKVFDATAGMGEDSFLLAAAGFDVTLCEYNDTIAALLEDALLRASEDENLAEIVSRMHLVKGNSAEVMSTIGADVIYLDPMFPERKKSGLIKKKFQLLQELERPCGNDEELFAAAKAAAPAKIVVKRPVHAPEISGAKPSYVIKGSTIRYDCYV